MIRLTDAFVLQVVGFNSNAKTLMFRREFETLIVQYTGI